MRKTVRTTTILLVTALAVSTPLPGLARPGVTRGPTTRAADTLRATHLLNRARFGFRTAYLERILAEGEAAWLERQLHPARIPDSALGPRLARFPAAICGLTDQGAAGLAVGAGKRSLRQVAQLIKSDVCVEIAFADIGGWDTQQAQGGVDGQLARRFNELALGIRALYDDLGDRMDDVVILTMSEFGSTVAENGSGGTDHGHANCMMVMSGSVAGGRVLGDWPGLEPEQLYEARDLALTTDSRDVFAEIVSRHFGADLFDAVFPGHTIDRARWRGVIG